MNKKVAAGMTPGSHGSTFGGNPLAMAVGNTVMDIVSSKKFLENIKRLSVQWNNQFTFPNNGVRGIQETNYYVDYQGVRFIALNSTNYSYLVRNLRGKEGTKFKRTKDLFRYGNSFEILWK